MAVIRKRGEYQFQAIIRKAGYPPQSKTLPTREEAEAWAGLVESEMTRRVFICNREAERTTLTQAFERYWQEVGSRKKHPKQERQRINKWLQSPFRDRYLTSLRGLDFSRHRDERRAQGRAENTIRLELALISHLFEVARREWNMEGLLNPIKNIRMPSGSLERDRRLKPGEYDSLIAELRNSGNVWLAPAFSLAIETSLRQGMLFELRWEWVDLHSCVITIPPSLRGVGNKCVPAAIPLSTRAIAILKDLPKSSDGLILGCTQNALTCAWKRTLERLGYTKGDLRWHDLRHESASQFFERGLHPMEVAAITGHKNLSTLRRYTHLQASDLAKKLG